MSRDYMLLVDDIWDCARKVQRYSADMSLDRFLADEKTYDAVLRNLEIIGEAAKNLPEDIRSRIVGVEWTKVIGMRNYLAHVYFGISNDLVWDVVTTRIPELLAAIEAFRRDTADASLKASEGDSC